MWAQKICLCAYVCYVVYVCVCESRYVHLYAYIHRSEKESEYNIFLYHSTTCCLGGKFSCWSRSLTFWLSKLAHKLPGSVCHYSSIMKLQECTAICELFKLRASCLDNKYSYPLSNFPNPWKAMLYWSMINVKTAFYIDVICSNKFSNINIHFFSKWFYLVTRLAYYILKYEMNLLKQPRLSGERV